MDIRICMGLLVFMSFDNKSLLILGLIIGGLACIYYNNTELASAIFGGLVGYLSHGASGYVTGASGDEDIEE